jgi:tRNA dimethylallyltransferase
MQIYRELEILSNRPGAADLARAPHRLFGVLPATESCSAARWRELACAEIAAAQDAGCLPIVVGGTGLYFRALLTGLAMVPEIPTEVRAEAKALHKALGGAEFHRLLAARDPEGAAKLHPGDSQRSIRAFEVVTATGRPLSHWQNHEPAPNEPEFSAPDFGPCFKVLLDPPRPWLYARIDARFDAMLARGGLEEARALLKLGLAPDLPALKAVGVRELLAHLRGEITLEAAQTLAKQSSRRYAKRQVTWFRRQFERNLVITDASDMQQTESLGNKIFPFIREFMLTLPRPAV